MIIVNTEKELNTLRELRAKECFPVVNRGKLWYDCLSAEQLIELRDWYFNWLDVTETRTMPIAPSWLNVKLQGEEQLW